MAKFTKSGGDFELTDSGVTKWSSAWLTSATLPDNAVSVTGQTVDFGDLNKDNALFWSRLTQFDGAGYSGGIEHTFGYITAVDEETSYADITLGTVPAGIDFLRIQARINRTTDPTAPTPANMMTGALTPIPPENEWFMARGGFIPLEAAFPVARAISVVNDSGTLKLRRRQSIGKNNIPDDCVQGWSLGNAPKNYTFLSAASSSIQAGIVESLGEFTYDAAKGQPIYYLGEVSSAGSADHTNRENTTDTSYYRGGANQMDLTDTTNFQSVYSIDLKIEPGHFATDPVLKAPTGKSVLRAIYLYDTNSAGETTTTYSGVSIGNADSTRQVLVMIVGGSTGVLAVPPSSVTIGGITATQLALADPGADNFLSASIYMAAVPTGTTGAIVVNWTNPVEASSVLVYSLYHLSSTTPVDHETATADGTETSNISVTLHNTAGGFAFVCSAHLDTVTNGVPNQTLGGVNNPGFHPIVMSNGTTVFSSSALCIEDAVQGSTGTDLVPAITGETGRVIALAAVSLF